MGWGRKGGEQPPLNDESIKALQITTPFTYCQSRLFSGHKNKLHEKQVGQRCQIPAELDSARVNADADRKRRRTHQSEGIGKVLEGGGGGDLGYWVDERELTKFRSTGQTE